jgi:hypothetical protein
MCDPIVRVSDLSEFTAEVRKELPLRLTLTERWVQSQIPMKELELHLQGRNDLGEIVWLMESHRVVWLTKGPEIPRDESVHSGMLELQRIVREHLEDRKYKIRPGSYGLADNIRPINGRFEIAKWKKVGDDLETWVVVPLDQNGKD